MWLGNSIHSTHMCFEWHPYVSEKNKILCEIFSRFCYFQADSTLQFEKCTMYHMECVFRNRTWKACKRINVITTCNNNNNWSCCLLLMFKIRIRAKSITMCTIFRLLSTSVVYLCVCVCVCLRTAQPKNV